jgi:hypothetical protein
LIHVAKVVVNLNGTQLSIDLAEILIQQEGTPCFTHYIRIYLLNVVLKYLEILSEYSAHFILLVKMILPIVLCLVDFAWQSD